MKSEANSNKHVWGFNAIVEYVVLKYGYEDFFVAVQDLALQIFDALRSSSNRNVAESRLTIWMDDAPTIDYATQIGRRVARWRFFISGDKLNEQTVDCLAVVMKDEVGWSVSGWQPDLSFSATPLFEYSNGEYSVFFVRECSTGGNGIVGYPDIEYEGGKLRLVVAEMDATSGGNVRITTRTDNPTLFGIKYIQEVIGDEPVTIIKRSEIEDVKSLGVEATVKEMTADGRRRTTARIFFLSKQFRKQEPTDKYEK